MKLKIYCLILLSLICWNVNAQEEQNNKIHQIDLLLGVNHFSIKDKVFSPLIYRGIGMVSELQYRRISRKSINAITFGFDFPNTLDSSLDNFSNNSIQNQSGFLRYYYLHKIAKSKHSLYLGGSFNNSFSLRILDFVDTNINASEVAFDIFSSLEINGIFRKKYKKNHLLEWKISYPIIAYVIGKMKVPRDFPDDVLLAFFNDEEALPLADVLKSGNWLTVNKFIDLKSQLNYQFKFSKHWLVNLTYRFQFYKYPKFLEVRYGKSQYLMGLTYQF